VKSFVRRASLGLSAGVLLFAALNALSYFVRTGGDLQRRGGRIGFPWLAWADNGYPNGEFFPSALLANVCVGLAASAALGCLFALVVRGERPFSWPQFQAPARDRKGEFDGEDSPAESRPRQFTLRGLMLFTTAVAVLFAAGQEADEEAKRQILILAYWLGPTVLVAAFCLSSWLAPRACGQTMLVVGPLVLLATLILGASAGLNDMTRVALGFFIYWTPQCVLLLGFFAVWGLARSKT
jgi:hypothetical protein